MDGSVTPRRRRYSEDHSDDDGSTIGSKRARTETPDQPLLPNNFLRSPNGHNTTATPGKHQPGSIVRVSLTNFVTYTKAEFHPGPNLNMIIGPNGTGKSTLVCAICLGLGWSPNHLGRAKDIWEFIKHGAKRAVIEIELAADPERHEQNPVIRTVIVRAQRNPDFQIDGKKTSKTRVLELARSFSIQVDNLCQFLPQDRVVEFAALSPVNLLTQTQRAAAPEYMCDWHDELKALRKSQKTQQDDQQRLTEELKQLEQRHRLQEGDVVRLRERQVLAERIAALERLRPFPDYRLASKRHKDAKSRRKDAEDELKRLQRQVEPNLLAEREKQQYLERVEKVKTSRRNILERSETAANNHYKKQQDTQEKIDECTAVIDNEGKIARDAKSEAARYEGIERNLLRAMENVPPEFDPAAYNERIREKTRQVREVNDQINEIKDQVDNIAHQGRQRTQIRNDLEREKDSLQTQAGQQANKLKQASPQAAQAWQWIQEHRDRFEGDVYGPPIMECSVKDPQHAGAVETVISAGEMLAFTVTNRNDFRILSDVLYSEMKLSNISIRTSTQPLDYFRSPCSTEQLQALGLQSWVVDLVEGPEPVLAMLCDNRMLHQTGFSNSNFSDSERRNLEQSGIISSWVTPSETCQITRRKDYGPLAVSTRTNPVRPAKYFTDAPVDQGHESDLDRRINDINQDLNDLKQQIVNLKARNVELNEQRKKVLEEESKLKEEKSTKQRQQAEFAGLPIKLEQARNRKRTALETIEATKERRLDMVIQGDRLSLEKGQQALDYANAVDALRNLHVQLLEAEIIAIEAKSDLEQLQARTTEERLMLNQRTVEAAELKHTADALLAEGLRLQAICQELAPEIRGEDSPLYDVYGEVSEWDPDQLETEIQSCQARFDMNDGPSGGQRVLQEYEDRASKIERRRGKLAEVETSLQEVETKITEVREQWEPQLDQLVAQISEAFADNFAKIQCAGEVAVHKDEDFELWAIQIKVKFREHEQLSILDSHRQSGGERAVSTIFYLMALQSLARAPFRVVDEINQGMDPRNERLVHSRMVDIACSENSASQYFLITPKLLNGLKYHPSMKVHCIASGEYMPEDHRTLNFGALAEKALAMRGQGAVAAAG